MILFFLQVLDYPFTGESYNTLFRDPNNTVITRQLANRLFGKNDPLGKTIVYNEHVLTVKGIIEESNTKTSVRFDILLGQGLQWRWPPVQNASIARMFPNTNIEQVNERIKHRQPDWEEKKDYFQFFPFPALYLDKNVEKESSMFYSGNRQYLAILGVINILVLLIGIFNFINIYTVIISRRGKELGLKKVFGVNRRQIFMQLYTENFIQIAMAVFTGWTIIEVTKGLFSSWLDIHYAVNSRFDLLLSAGLLFLIPLLTSLYPFFRFAYSQPVRSLKEVNTSPGTNFIRNTLLAVQYIFTFCVLITVLFLTRQLYLLTHTHPGYQQENILKAQFQRNDAKMFYTNEDIEKSQHTQDLIRQQMNASPLFETWTFGITPNEYPENNLQVSTTGGEQLTVTHLYTTEKYFPLLDLQIKEGRSWDPAEDYPGSLHMIINESARKMLGINDIGQETIQPEYQLYYNEEGDIHDSNPPYLIIGIMEDFYPKHLANGTTPLVFTYGERQLMSITLDKMIARHIPGKRKEAIEFLQLLFEETIGGEFEYSFLSDEVNSLYNEDKKVSHIYTLFSCMVLLISSLGLFSISLFDIRNKYKSIAIHKINGATDNLLLKMLGKKYLILLITAFTISIPLAWLGIIKYMESISQGTGTIWWIFPLSFIITGIISWITLCWQLKKAIRMNPVDAIRSE
ncbi:MAG: FtsX-like permease family protein [Tannerellaceae bacterium]|nr:FtsX-like permease family protein [Tannerellaceae bacterium]